MNPSLADCLLSGGAAVSGGDQDLQRGDDPSLESFPNLESNRRNAAGSAISAIEHKSLVELETISFSRQLRNSAQGYWRGSGPKCRR